MSLCISSKKPCIIGAVMNHFFEWFSFSFYALQNPYPLCLWIISLLPYDATMSIFLQLCSTCFWQIELIRNSHFRRFLGISIQSQFC